MSLQFVRSDSSSSMVQGWLLRSALFWVPRVVKVFFSPVGSDFALIDRQAPPVSGSRENSSTGTSGSNKRQQYETGLLSVIFGSNYLL
jgi:hypothetical protein